MSMPYVNKPPVGLSRCMILRSNSLDEYIQYIMPKVVLPHDSRYYPYRRYMALDITLEFSTDGLASAMRFSPGTRRGKNLLDTLEQGPFLLDIHGQAIDTT